MPGGVGRVNASVALATLNTVSKITVTQIIFILSATFLATLFSFRRRIPNQTTVAFLRSKKKFNYYPIGMRQHLWHKKYWMWKKSLEMKGCFLPHKRESIYSKLALLSFALRVCLSIPYLLGRLSNQTLSPRSAREGENTLTPHSRERLNSKLF